MSDILPIGGYVKGKAHYLPVRIYYADTDFSGLVYHGRHKWRLSTICQEWSMALADHLQ